MFTTQTSHTIPIYRGVSNVNNWSAT